MSKKIKKFAKDKGLLGCKKNCVKNLNGTDYEDYLKALLGGKGSFKSGGVNLMVQLVTGGMKQNLVIFGKI